MDHVGREALQTDHEMREAAGLEVEPHARLQIEEGADRAAVEHLNFGILQCAAEFTLAFGFEHEAIDVAAIPGLRIPHISVFAAIGCNPRFQPLDQDRAGGHAAVFACQLRACGGHCVAAPDCIGRISRAFQCARRDGVFGCGPGCGLVRHRCVRSMVHARHGRLVIGALVRRALLGWKMPHRAMIDLGFRRGFLLNFGRAFFGRQVAHRTVIHLGLRGRLLAVRRMVLCRQRSSRHHRRGKHCNPHHDVPPSGNGRTVTTCIIPACMW